MHRPGERLTPLPTAFPQPIAATTSEPHKSPPKPPYYSHPFSAFSLSPSLHPMPQACCLPACLLLGLLVATLARSTVDMQLSAPTSQHCMHAAGLHVACRQMHAPALPAKHLLNIRHNEYCELNVVVTSIYASALPAAGLLVPCTDPPPTPRTTPRFAPTRKSDVPSTVHPHTACKCRHAGRHGRQTPPLQGCRKRRPTAENAGGGWVKKCRQCNTNVIHAGVVVIRSVIRFIVDSVLHVIHAKGI